MPCGKKAIFTWRFTMKGGVNVNVEKIATITLVPESEKEAEIFKNIKGVLITTENEQFVYIYIITDKAVADVVADETDNKFRFSGLKTKERSWKYVTK